MKYRIAGNIIRFYWCIYRMNWIKLFDCIKKGGKIRMIDGRIMKYSEDENLRIYEPFR